MSSNRRITDVPEMSFADILERCIEQPLLRAQGKNRPESEKKRRLVRFNRAVIVLPGTIREGKDGLIVTAMRTKKHRGTGEFVPTGESMDIAWNDLDWVTWDMSADPNGEWLKVTARGNCLDE